MQLTQCLGGITLLMGALIAQPALGGAPSARAAVTTGPAGGKIFRKWCGDCHGAPQGPGSIGLQRKYQGAVPAVLEQRTDLNPEYVKLVVRRGVSFMPSFRKTEISDAELALVAAYLVSGPGPAAGKRF